MHIGFASRREGFYRVMSVVRGMHAQVIERHDSTQSCFRRHENEDRFASPYHKHINPIELHVDIYTTQYSQVGNQGLIE